MDINWLINEIKQVAILNQVQVYAIELELKLKNIFINKLKHLEWKLSEFLSLVVGLQFINHFIHDVKTVPSIYIDERIRGTSYRRPLLPTDVEELVKDIQIYYIEKYNFLRKLAEDKNLGNICSPATWLNLVSECKRNLVIQTKFINYKVIDAHSAKPKTIEMLALGGILELVPSQGEIEQLIRYQEYDLSLKEEEECNFKFPLTYNLDELSERWGTNTKNILAACISTNFFWAYINLTTDMTLNDFHDAGTVTQIRSEIIKGEIDKSYKYPINEYVRVAKQKIASGVTLGYFYSNIIVKSKKFSSISICIDPPLCKRVLGVYAQYIDTDHDLAPTLYFMQDEIHSFERTDEFVKLFPLNKILRNNIDDKNIQALNRELDEDDQPLERSAIIENYKRLTKDAWEKVFQRKLENCLIDAEIPGKKPFQYSKKLIEKWLITKGYYKKNDLKAEKSIKNSRPGDLSDLMG